MGGRGGGKKQGFYRIGISAEWKWKLVKLFASRERVEGGDRSHSLSLFSLTAGISHYFHKMARRRSDFSYTWARGNWPDFPAQQPRPRNKFLLLSELGTPQTVGRRDTVPWTDFSLNDRDRSNFGTIDHLCCKNMKKKKKLFILKDPFLGPSKM